MRIIIKNKIKTHILQKKNIRADDSDCTTKFLLTVRTIIKQNK